MNLENKKHTERDVPKHIAIIMDGNGRWAQKRGLQRVEGHKEGIEAVKRTVKAAAKFGVKYLTLYTFSTENWNRPKAEVDALMAMMAQTIARETAELLEAGIRIKMIGNKMDLPEGVREQFNELEAKSANNSALTLLLAISYGSRWEILQAAKAIAEDYKNGLIDNVDNDLFASKLTTADVPDPDLLIRTGGECRLSNFLLWQCAYTEFMFIDKYWPEFGEGELEAAIKSFVGRERRFGMTGEQVRNSNEE